MEAVKIIEKLLTTDYSSNEKHSTYESCVVCSSSMVSRIQELLPESFIISNAAFQIFPNLASVYYSVEVLKVSLIAITGTTAVNVEKFVNLDFQAADVEFKLLRKVYENNIDILLPLYDKNEKQLNAAFVEMNIDAQIGNLLSIPEFKTFVSKEELHICGLVLDESGVYGNGEIFYLVNFNGLKDPDEIRNHDFLKAIPEAIRKQKIKRIHVQF